MFPWRWIIHATIIAHAHPRLDRAGGTPRHLAHRRRDPLAAPDPDPALPDLRRRREGERAVELASLPFLGALAAQFAPVVLVAYITTMFAADIRYVLQRAKLLSELDDLTALYNTRGFAIAADRLFGQALRYTRPASVLMVDLDNLKAVNDSHGHDAGNRLLRHTANALRAEL